MRKVEERKTEGEREVKEEGKFILLYVSNEDSKEMIKHVLDEGVERGVFLKSYLANNIVQQFDFLKDRGYFPNAMILSKGSDLVEFAFRRHPQQDPSKKLQEFVNEDKFKL
jgi:hypothetical protein